MTALDMKKDKYKQVASNLVNAAQSDDEKVFQEAFVAFASQIEQGVLAEHERLQGEENVMHDSAALIARGQRQLTSQEKEFYQEWIKAAKSENPKQALENANVTLPKSTITDVFTDLESEHPLLKVIEFQNTGGVVEWIINEGAEQLATWSPLCAEIVKELTSGFKKINLTLNKLSAFLPVCKAMLELGPIWLDKYVRTVLQEALYCGLEDGIINGRGQNANIFEPIGMTRNLTGSVNPTTGYPEKTPITVTSFGAAQYGALIAKLAQTETGKIRSVSDIILIVNPLDYFTKILPATTIRGVDGKYINDIFPFPTEVIQSTRIKEGHAVLGLKNRYFMGIGAGQSGRIEFSDENRFLEDERVYIVKLYGHGQPKDNNAYLLLDISGVQAIAQKVEVVGDVSTVAKVSK